MVPDADGKWKYTFTAPKYDENDKEIVYSVKESAVAGFHASYEGYNILNTYIKPVTVALPKVYKEVRESSHLPKHLYSCWKGRTALLCLTSQKTDS